ncbi:NAD(P)/FAD-dependent oxidoreductase [Rhodococcus marinonascens]|uniref:NAD(P)/FAD-dependent oxidoreductase n=1 Tax=Rhodococcus marinonascens TaxID=38311 RepID=UPI000933640C|nr:FAD-dependent oxidoreductase [Rhodococcus marinonascens]
MRVLVLGAGFGGLELTTELSDALGEEAEVILIDKTEGFVFGFSKLDVMFGRATPESVFHPYRDCIKPGVEFVQATILSIDPMRRRVQTDAGPYEGDVLVVALGADLDPAATPGLLEGGQEFYTEAGAFAAADVLADFSGGRVIVGVTSTPFKCPPAPSEAALLLHDFLTERGLREGSDISLVLPLPSPFPPAPDASRAVLAAFKERGIGFYPNDMVREIDPVRNIARLAGGDEMEYDLFLGVPVHRVPAVVEEAGMCVDGWVPVDPYTLQTRFTDVFALGDVASVGTPKTGVFAAGQAVVVAQALIARCRGGQSQPYGGRGICHLEFGNQQVATIDVTFPPGKTPHGAMVVGPSAAIAADKSEFAATKIRRWFGRD